MKKDITLDICKTNFVYLGGKVTGLTPSEYHTNFDKYKEWLQTKIPDEYQIIVPVDLCNDNWSWFKCMDICVEILKKCICLYLMPDWKDSKGAVCEKYIAEALGLRVVEIGEDKDSGEYFFINHINGFTDKYTKPEYKVGDIVGHKLGPLVKIRCLYDSSTKAVCTTSSNSLLKLDVKDIIRLANYEERSLFTNS